MTEERRTEARDFPRRLSVRVVLPGGVAMDVQILNESSKGLGLFCASAATIKLGDQVEVVLADQPARMALVRHVETPPKGGINLGLEWAN